MEVDLNADGFGDYIIWAHPPYRPAWETGTVQVFKDSNHDTGGLSPVQSDASSNGNGYDTLVFDGGASQNADPDLAWVRINGGDEATIQFAFKKSLTGSSFTMGVVSDAGLKDVSKFDYSDRFKEADGGSPVRNKKYYPLGSLYAVDNTCWEEYGIKATVNELRVCEVFVKPIHKPSGNESSCPSPPTCGNAGYNPSTCQCNP